MRYWRSKAICSLTLAAFLVADGLALARTLRQTYCCQTDAEFARSEAGPGCCENCECKPTTVAAESTVTLPGPAKDGLRPSCPCQNRPCPTCPCPGGCSHCSVAKVLCAGQTADLIASACPLQWNWLDPTNCYSSPYHVSCTPPPRA